MHLPKREDELVQAIFHVEVMDDLNKMYLDQKRNDEAQKIMIAARELRKKYNLPKDSLLAGMTQMLSGQRIVETEIKNREAIDNTKPAYWMERANYYQGRKEPLEQEKALRKALSLYDTPELRGKNPNPSFCDVRSSLNYCLKKANRQADMYELFLQQHKIVKDEPRNLWELYSEGINNGIFAERKDEFLRLLSEDIKKAVNCYKTASITKKQKPFSELHTGLNLIIFSPELAVSMRIFDFQNDPDAWDILKFQNHTFVKEKIIQLSLFQEDKNGITLANENMIELFYTALEEKKLPVELYYSMGKVIRAKATQLKNIDGYKTALKFFKGALTHLDQFPNNYPKYSIHSEIASCYLKIGDWRNGEKYTVESYENSGLRKYEVVSWLDHAARVADKAGEKNEAKRIRQRITNLGIQ
jgi:tetratricopeptide (TPR) repeat protein